METKQQMNIEEAADNHIREVVDAAGHPGWDWTTQDIADAFIAGANWQKQHDAELIEIAYNDGITIGMTKQKEQMLKDAVEAEILLTPYPTICLDDCKDYDFKDGQKVRIIIVKEDKK